MSFAAAFDFRRAQMAPFTDAAGQPQVAAIDQPRLDHTPAGEPKGLAIAGKPVLPRRERVTVKEGLLPDGGPPCVVLHEYERRDGEIVRQAIVTQAPRSTANALLNLDGWQRRIAVLRGVLDVVEGVITYHGLAYPVAGRLYAAPGQLLLTAAGGGHLLIARKP